MISRHLRSNLIAYLALFVALGGSAYAIGRGEVKTKHLAKSAVKTGKIADNAIKARKIRDGAVTAEKLADGIAGLPGQPGADGEKGEQGEQGDPGAPGAPATTLFAHVNTDGSLNYGSGVEGVDKGDAGIYYIEFDRDISDCVPLGGSGVHYDRGSSGQVSGNIHASILPAATRKVEVRQSLPDEDFSTDVDGAFFLAVFCP